MVEFRILRQVSRGKSRTKTLDFRRVDFNLFRLLLERIPWVVVQERRGIQRSWLIFKDHLLQVQEWSIPTCRSSSKGSRRPAWVSKQVLAKPKHKKKAHRGGSRGRPPVRNTETLLECAGVGLGKSKPT